MDPQLSATLLTNAFVLLIVTTLRMATPLIFAALGGVFSERAGVVNVGLEGMMLMGAFFAMAGSYYTGHPWLGFLLAAVAGGVFALIHAVASIHLRGNQVVSGMALNVIAMALTGFLLRQMFHHAGQSPQVTALAEWRIPVFAWISTGLGWIPWLGKALAWFFNLCDKIFGQATPPVYLAIVLAFLAHAVIFRTPWGLRLRAVGENPEASESLGVSVYGLRYAAVVLSGILGGMGGATLSIGLLNIFSENMTVGRGFIALAAMIFGKWKPKGALGACLLFGLFGAFEVQAQTFASMSSFFSWMKIFAVIPREVFLGLPYLATILILAGFIGRSTAPAADGLPYEARK